MLYLVPAAGGDRLALLRSEGVIHPLVFVILFFFS